MPLIHVALSWIIASLCSLSNGIPSCGPPTYPKHDPAHERGAAPKNIKGETSLEVTLLGKVTFKYLDDKFKVRLLFTFCVVCIRAGRKRCGVGLLYGSFENDMRKVTFFNC